LILLLYNNLLEQCLLVDLVYRSFPEETVAVAGETVQKIQFHPTLDNILGVLGSPGPVITVLRATGPALITEPLTVIPLLNLCDV